MVYCETTGLTETNLGDKKILFHTKIPMPSNVLFYSIQSKVIPMRDPKIQNPLRYAPNEIDKKWQTKWHQDGTYKTHPNTDAPKWYELAMYPYPSGDLHIGHWYAMAPADAHARYKRMQGFNVLHPMGFDSFGLPAENAAIKRQIHPHEWTMGNIERMRGQLQSIGAIYDWDREIICSLPEYYTWNQWLFTQFFKEGLAYKANASANWCSSCNTVLANEQVVNGACERCETIVYKRDLNQWFLSITKYAEELLVMDDLDWPEKIKLMQKNWIGKSEGVTVDFDISHLELNIGKLSTFTTRVDTLYGVTFIVLAPEHPLVRQLTTAAEIPVVEEYIEAARRKTDIDRLSADDKKTGVFLGSYCSNPLTGESVPIFIGDYVLASYGTGVVMGVPAHDQRDFEFATTYNLPIKLVIAENDSITETSTLNYAWTGSGKLVNSGKFTGLLNSEATNAIATALELVKKGSSSTSYRIRDWLVSRQRYWGTPIPIVHCSLCGPVAVPENELPVLLPEDAEFLPTGESPLEQHPTFKQTTCPSCKNPAERETDTLDTFFDSSWYFLRYTDPTNTTAPFDSTQVNTWCPVDQYTGGAEHAVMHLLYARFFTKVLRDLGLVKFGEPFTRLFNQGTIILNQQKMSKSRGNVVSPDEYVSQFGADVVRTYLMFLGPWDQGGEWNDSGLNGVVRWFNRLWDLTMLDTQTLTSTKDTDDIEFQRLVHKTVKKVLDDTENFKFNTALATLMALTNEMAIHWGNNSVRRVTWSDCITKLLLMLAPIAPHLSEELWEKTGHLESVHNQSLPSWDSDLAYDQTMTLVIQLNGKVRDRITTPIDISQSDAEEIALTSDRIRQHLKNHEIQKIIFVPGRLINVVSS
jgi:leucyl-tRNA synthetase